MKWHEKLRAEFPITGERIYVDIAFSNPLANSVMTAMNSFCKRVNEGKIEKKVWLQQIDGIRSKIAEMVNGKTNEIAFTKNTAEAANIMAQSLPWGVGDNVIITDQEHPNNLFPWLNLRNRDIEVRVVEAQYYRLPVDLILAKVDKHTRAIAISSVQFCSGFRVDLATLGSECKKRGIWLIVDAIQSLGTLKLDAPVMNIDAVSCGGHKGILATYGVGFLYCNEKLLEKLNPAYIGMTQPLKLNKEKGYDIAISSLKDAKRLELGTLNFAGIFGLEKGIDLIQDCGIENIEKRILFLSNMLNKGLRELGYEVISSDIPCEQSNIVVVKVPSPQGYIDYLTSKGIKASIMDAGVIRFSFHAYNNELEVAKILQVSEDYKRK